MNRIANRRYAALLKGLAMRHTARLSLLDPLFNIREILKQMVLLEDHLTHAYKFCPDCIRKHLLTIEAFGDEGVTLDTPQGHYRKMLTALAEKARVWMESFHDQVDPAQIALDVRKIRKMLAPAASDPRAPSERSR